MRTHERVTQEVYTSMLDALVVAESTLSSLSGADDASTYIGSAVHEIRTAISLATEGK